MVKRILIIACLLLLLLKSEVVSLGVACVLAGIGLVKFLKYMAKGGAFD